MEVTISKDMIKNAIQADLDNTVRYMDLFDSEELSNEIYKVAKEYIKEAVEKNRGVIKEKLIKEVGDNLSGIFDDIMNSVG